MVLEISEAFSRGGVLARGAYAICCHRLTSLAQRIYSTYSTFTSLHLRHPPIDLGLATACCAGLGRFDGNGNGMGFFRTGR